MGTSSSGSELAGKLNRLASDLADQQRALNVTALAGKKIFQHSASAAGVSRVVKARYDIHGRQAVVRYVGWRAPMLEGGAKPHRIEPKTRRRRGARRRALSIGGNVRAYANHPGFTGKRFFRAARVIAGRELPRVYMREAVTRPLRRIFG